MITPQGEFLEKAKTALKNDDQRAAFILLRKALEQDANNQDAWRILYANFGNSEPYSEFQTNFVARYLQKDTLLQQTIPKRTRPRRNHYRIEIDPTIASFIAGSITGSISLLSIAVLLQRDMLSSPWAIVPGFCRGLVGILGSYLILLRLRKRVSPWQRYPISIGVGIISGLTVAPVVIFGIGLVLRALM